MSTTTGPKPRTQRVVTPRVAPDYSENDRIVEMEELRKFKTRLEWLGNPMNQFNYSIASNGECHVFRSDSRFDFVAYRNLAEAIDAKMLDAHRTPER